MLARFRTFLVIVVLSSLPMAPAAAGPFEDGFAAASRGDYTTAYRLWRPLAEQGVPGAQYNLGVMYANGEGVPKDEREAVRWYRKAAEQGAPSAQFNLAYLYATGRGVPKDDVQAYVWWNLAAAQGHEDANKNREIIARSMTPSQIAEAQAFSRNWKPKK
jgi:TPR repeat protein